MCGGQRSAGTQVSRLIQQHFDLLSRLPCPHPFKPASVLHWKYMPPPSSHLNTGAAFLGCGIGVVELGESLAIPSWP